MSFVAAGWAKRITACVLFPVLAGEVAFAQPVNPPVEKAAGETLPGAVAPREEDALVVLEIPRPRELVAELTNHPLLDRILELDGVRRFQNSAQFLQFRIGLALLEGQAGHAWPELLSRLAGGGLAVRVDDGGRRIVLLAHSEDEATLRRVLGSVLEFANGQARNLGQPAPFRTVTDGETRLAIGPGVVLARRGADWVIANREDDARRALEQPDGWGLPAAQSSEANSGTDSSDSSGGSVDAGLWVNLHALRESGLARELLSGMTDNAAAELLFGGVLDGLHQASALRATADLRSDRIAVCVELPFDASGASEARAYFFGADGTASAPRWLEAGDFLASFSLWRDLAAWWLAKDRLFDRNVVAQLVQADSQISTLFSGLDFGGEVLGALEPGFQLVARGQEFAEEISPAVRLPEFALVGRLREPSAMGRRFKVAFQSVMGFVNLGLAQSGQPQFDVNTATTPQGCVCTSRVLSDDGLPATAMAFNFSPSLIIDGSWIVLSSSEKLATDLKTRLAEGVSSGAALPANTALRIDLAQLGGLLRQNLVPLVANNMLESGRSRGAAEQQVLTAIGMVELLNDLSIRLETDGGRLRIAADLTFAGEAGR